MRTASTGTLHWHRQPAPLSMRPDRRIVELVMRRRAKWFLLLTPILLLGLAHADRDADSIGNWRQASRASAGLAPDPAVTREPVVQVYAARAVRWRGYFGVHTWIAAKPANAEAFTVYEVTGFAVRRGGSAVRVSQRAPDGRWFGSMPELLADVRGAGVGALIGKIERAVEAYPYQRSYRIWPGPNSNTFTAFVLRQVPELRVDFPGHAIGKDYLGSSVFARTPSGTGRQASLFGVLGVAGGAEEGVELNVLGLTFGVDPDDLGLKLPLVGRLGFGARTARAEQLAPLDPGTRDLGPGTRDGHEHQGPRTGDQTTGRGPSQAR